MVTDERIAEIRKTDPAYADAIEEVRAVSEENARRQDEKYRRGCIVSMRVDNPGSDRTVDRICLLIDTPRTCGLDLMGKIIDKLREEWLIE